MQAENRAGARENRTVNGRHERLQLSHRFGRISSGVFSLYLALMVLCGNTSAKDILDTVQHGYVDSSGVSIHYVTMGEGPLLVMLHGFPDFWYTWRNMMPSLAKQYRVLAIDLRGYNLSGRPEGVENYSMPRLISDVVATINHWGGSKASYPNPGRQSNTGSVAPAAKPLLVQAPTLVIFGLEDQALLPAGFNNTWDQVDAELTMVAIPDAAHFVHHDAPDAVLSAIHSWLSTHQDTP